MTVIYFKQGVKIANDKLNNFIFLSYFNLILILKLRVRVSMILYVTVIQSCVIIENSKKP